MQESERRRAIAEALAKLPARPRVSAVSTGCLSLDWALGPGGFPRGLLTEIYGPEACGKTTIALSASVGAQRAGGTAAYLDADHALDAGYARALGLDLDRLLLGSPSSGEEALEVTARLAASRAVDLVVIDSVAALVPRMELESGPGDACPGLQHHLIGHALRRLALAAARGDCAVVAVNQIRSRPGAAVGDPETTAGGYGLRLHASLRAEVRPVGGFEGGMRVRVRLVKNRLAPLREASFEILWGSGIARHRDLATAAARCGIAADERVLAADPEACAALEQAVRRAFGLEMAD